MKMWAFAPLPSTPEAATAAAQWACVDSEGALTNVSKVLANGASLFWWPLCLCLTSWGGLGVGGGVLMNTVKVIRT